MCTPGRLWLLRSGGVRAALGRTHQQGQIDVAALIEAAARYQDKDCAPTSAAPKITPLFSDRRNDGFYGYEALPRRA
ncbi:hypothetical protein [Mobiluncus curtisii]|uniref:Uncharacterized protein n=2 Tax=Mobiluncus curtisii TaxID=2051 RepID=D6ZHH2_MOBCV|nr:hypothetical protein [Mobiluncus curtisii]ADI68080.1 hypothetical protein HMPREF0573_11761 [Mobiluncus curtisii ATCC 43063]MCU9987349.1 hypothetical protein [Mobiluncus curtisii]NMW44701.1 hypothetical protein [Mobiluncus curtisii]NMW49635.1 hypothetical protein [Mobiluncus curtisii]NMW83445.1 hypothetical protein [Mobiluncus curtisii]